MFSASPAKADKKKAVAKKSTTQGSTLNTGQIWEAPWLKIKKDKGGTEDKKPSLKVQSPGKKIFVFVKIIQLVVCRKKLLLVCRIKKILLLLYSDR